MIELDVDDEMALRALPPHAPPEAIQQALERIADKHGRDWVDWPTWQISGLGGMTPIAWAATFGHKSLHPQLVGIAFRSFLPTLHDPADVRDLFRSFGDSLHTLGQAEAWTSDFAEAQSVKQQAVDAIVEMLVAVGRERAPFALAAVGLATNDSLSEWLAQAWGKAEAAFDRAGLQDLIRVPVERAKEDDPSIRSGLR